MGASSAIDYLVIDYWLLSICYWSLLLALRATRLWSAAGGFELSLEFQSPQSVCPRPLKQIRHGRKSCTVGPVVTGAACGPRRQQSGSDQLAYLK
jgi:hypothetical protein